MSAFGGSQQIGAYHIALGADETPALRALDHLRTATERTVGGLQRQTSGIGSAFAGIGRAVSGVAGATMTMAALVAGAMSVVGAAGEAAAKATHRLERSLELTGRNKGIEQLTMSFDTFTQKIERVTGLSDNFIKKLTAIGASKSGLRGDALQQAVGAAIGLSAQYEHLGISAEDAMNIVAGAAKGDFSGLARLGIDVSKAGDAYAQYMAVIRMGLPGLAEAELQTDTMGAGLKMLANSAQRVLVALDGLFGISGNGSETMATLAGYIDSAAASISKLKPYVDEARESLLALFGIGETGGSFLDTASTAISTLVDSWKTEVQILFTYVQQGFEWVASQGPEFLIGAFGDVVTAIKNLWAELINWMSQNLMTAISGPLLSGVNALRTSFGYSAIPQSAVQAATSAAGFAIQRQTESEVQANNEKNMLDFRDRRAAWRRDHGLPEEASDWAGARDRLISGFDQRTKDRDADLQRKAAERAANRNNSAGANLAEQLRNFLPPSSTGTDPNARPRPQSIQTAIGDLAIPGMESQLGIMRNQASLQTSMNKHLAAIAAAAKQRRYRV